MVSDSRVVCRYKQRAMGMPKVLNAAKPAQHFDLQEVPQIRRVRMRGKTFQIDAVLTWRVRGAQRKANWVQGGEAGSAKKWQRFETAFKWTLSASLRLGRAGVVA